MEIANNHEANSRLIEKALRGEEVVIEKAGANPSVRPSRSITMTRSMSP